MLGFNFQCMISENKCISAHIHTLFEVRSQHVDGGQKICIER